jgi:pyruvate-ferredoxin/flavodoxin oxidoreductase
MTVSHLRFGPDPIRSTYLISKANFVACHQFEFLERIDVLAAADAGRHFLLNAPYGPDEIWDHLPRRSRRRSSSKKLKFFVIDGYTVAREAGMGNRINTDHADLLLRDQRRAAARRGDRGRSSKAIKKTYGKRGARWCRRTSPRSIARSPIARGAVGSTRTPRSTLPPVPRGARPSCTTCWAMAIAGNGRLAAGKRDAADGTFPTGTAKWEKRNIAQMIPGVGRGPVHPVRQVRAGLPARGDPRQGVRPALLADAPATFKSAKPKFREAARRCSTRCRWRRKIAPAAPCASRSAR